MAVENRSAVLHLHDAASAIARAAVANENQLWQESIDAAQKNLEAAAESGRLRIRHPETLLPEVFAEWAPPSQAGLVCTIADIDAWLAAEGVPYRWADVQPFESAQPEGPETPETPESPDQKHLSDRRQRVIDALRMRFGDPLNLPMYPQGSHQGDPAKKAARQAVSELSEPVFRELWTSLRASGEIDPRNRQAK